MQQDAQVYRVQKEIWARMAQQEQRDHLANGGPRAGQEHKVKTAQREPQVQLDCEATQEVKVVLVTLELEATQVPWAAKALPVPRETLVQMVTPELKETLVQMATPGLRGMLVPLVPPVMPELKGTLVPRATLETLATLAQTV